MGSARVTVRLIRVMWLIRCTIVPAINRIARFHHIRPVWQRRRRAGAVLPAGGRDGWPLAGEGSEPDHRLNGQTTRLPRIFRFGTAPFSAAGWRMSFVRQRRQAGAAGRDAVAVRYQSLCWVMKTCSRPGRSGASRTSRIR